jgi:GNAT superfamily N-acetyltransferase
MDLVVRSARSDDLASIANWTKDTFEWGDYVPERLPQWMDDPESEILVCVDVADMPLAIVHVRMLAATEGWLEAARVHPDHKRSGMGTALNHAGVDWARSRGARVVRLATETGNLAARKQVEKLGYRAGSSWVTAFMESDRSFRAETAARLAKSASIDVDSAWMFWSTSELGGAGRSLLSDGWQWREARVDDLTRATRDGRLFQSPAGWVMFRPDGSGLETMWLASSPQDLPRLLEGIKDLAATQGTDQLVVKVPGLDWASEALRRAQFSVSDILVYYKGISRQIVM